MVLRSLSAAVAAPGNRVALLHDGEACLSAMLAAIKAARREILLEMYWFGSDATGRKFAAALKEQAERGVVVCITYDAFGSWDASSAMFDELRAAGCSVYAYNPLTFVWRLRFRLGNRRNHRKMLIIDGQLGLLGGVNLADPWAPESQGGHDFHDDMVSLEGPAVAQMRDLFLTTFRFPPGSAIQLPTTQTPAAVGDISVLVLANDRRRNRRVIERAYIEAIARARKRVVIENSYFIPNFRVRRALIRAVRRGVEVTAILPFTSDVPAVAYATRRLYTYLLKRGIRIYELGERVLHSKVALADDWCTVGSHNLDYRSLFYNLEVNVIIEHPSVATALGERLDRDLGEAVFVDLQRWKYRPLFDRLLEEFFYRFRRLL